MCIRDVSLQISRRAATRAQAVTRDARLLCWKTKPLGDAFEWRLSEAMTIKYSRDSKNPSKACKAQGVDLRVRLAT